MKWLEDFTDGLASRAKAFKHTGQSMAANAEIDARIRQRIALEKRRMNWLAAGLRNADFDKLISEEEERKILDTEES